ncbi:IclR family transcriptional regulator [Paeniglutamicibacter sp. MACA_103]|uniref:IclR family transcriptional regulator n=1 Tax=Paeniglutamicibacter sp. MACA_103 TaxID=3377337 RepID=UPI003893E7BF
MSNSTPDAAASEAESWTDSTAHPPVESVDRALQLALLLRFGGALTVTEAAARLGVAVSTAHRLLAALTYRGFASQDRERRYVAGPILAAQAVGAIARSSLRDLARPALERLHARLNETVGFMVLEMGSVRFLDGIDEMEQNLRVVIRVGDTLPASDSAGGKALLAQLRNDDLAAVVTTSDSPRMQEGPELNGVTGVTLATLKRQLAGVRRSGYGVNYEETSPGICGVGVAIPTAGQPLGAFTVVLPASRFHRDEIQGYVEALTEAAEYTGRRIAELTRSL